MLALAKVNPLPALTSLFYPATCVVCAAAIERREQERRGTAYDPGKFSVGALQALLREETERIGLWLDTTRLSAQQAVEAIVADLDASRVRVLQP